MSKKQKKVLRRIIIAAVLMVVLYIAHACLGVERRDENGARINEWVIREPVWFFLYMIPYGIIGYDILRKAVKGIMNREVFDENFLTCAMASSSPADQRTSGEILLGISPYVRISGARNKS